MATLTASYPSLTLRPGQSNDSTISSGLIQAPAVERSGPTDPPWSPTRWHDRQANFGEANTSAPRPGSPCPRASEIKLATFAMSAGAVELTLGAGEGGGGTGVRGLGRG